MAKEQDGVEARGTSPKHGVEETLSPSGHYRLVIRYDQASKTAGGASRGTVYRVGNDKPICDIERNHGTFEHSFVTHGGIEWFIAGRSYLSQTVVRLDTGQMYESDDDPTDGAFVWVAACLSPDGKTLAVDGCVWACPYEYRFFDFGDPASGWPELPLVGVDYLPVCGDQAPSWLDATTFECACDGQEAGAGYKRVRREGGVVRALAT